MALAGRVALVTGAAHRVGRCLTLALADSGMRIGLHYNASGGAAEQFADELRSRNVDVATFPADLSGAAAPAELVRAVTDRFGALDLLVNSAAVMLRTPVDDVTTDQWDSIFALNVRAPFFLCQAARPFLARDRGCVVNIADLAAFETWPAYVPHSVSKAAVVQMTRSLARAFAPEIRVNAIAPGAVLLPESWDDDSANRLISTTPLGRLGSPQDVAGALMYLATAEYVTGETILVDGGRRVRN